MEDKKLLTTMWGICVESVKNANITSINVGRLNDTLIELRKRLVALGVDMDTLEK